MKRLNDYLNRNGITYNQYLNSDHWRDVRKRFYASRLHDGKCYSCGSVEKLQLHHKTYKRLGNERLNDLCLLCDECHGRTHKIIKNGESKLFKAARKLRKSIGKRLGQIIPINKKHKETR